MKPRRESESWRVNAESRAAIDRAIASIVPDSEHPRAELLRAAYRKGSQRQRRRLTFDLDHVQRFANADSRILEFGSYPPILTLALSRMGYSVCGLDLDPSRVGSTLRKEGLVVKKVDFERELLPFRNGAFDIVIFNEVFEHLRINPIFTFSEVHRVLSGDGGGGGLLLSTPNLLSLEGWYHLVVKGRMGRGSDIYSAYSRLQRKRIGHAGHIRLYSPVEVADFLGRMGFEVELIIHRGVYRSRSWRHRLGNRFVRLFPRLRRSFSVVARKNPEVFRRICG